MWIRCSNSGVYVRVAELIALAIREAETFSVVADLMGDKSSVFVAQGLESREEAQALIENILHREVAGDCWLFPVDQFLAAYRRGETTMVGIEDANPLISRVYDEADDLPDDARAVLSAIREQMSGGGSRGGFQQ